MDALEKGKNAVAVPPYVAYRTLKNFIRSLVQVIPNQIDKSTMTTLSGGVQIQLLQALRYLGLIAQNGAPTDRLKALVKSKDEGYKQELREILTTSYPFLENKTVNLANATMQQLQSEFSKLATGDTARKCVTFFIPAAIDAGYELSPYLKKPGARSTVNGKAKRTRQENKPKGPLGRKGENQMPPNGGEQIPTWQKLMLDKFPDFDPKWPDDLKTKWFEGFERLEKLMSK